MVQHDTNGSVQQEGMAAKPRQRKSPARSQYLFPVYDLGVALNVTQRVEEDGGGRLTEETLAINMGASAKSSAFRLKTLTARQFGLLDKSRGMLSTTQRAKAVFKPTAAGERERALRDSFLSMPLFRAVADRFRGQPLPDGDALRNVLEREFGVGHERVQSAERMLLDSARDSGCLVTNNGRTYLSTDTEAATENVFDEATPTTVMVPAGPPPDSRSQRASTEDAALRDAEHEIAVARGLITISEEDIAGLGDPDFESVWNALGTIVRARGRRQAAHRESLRRAGSDHDVPEPIHDE